MTKRILLFLFLLSSFKALYAQETQRVYLSGKGNDQTVSWDFFCTEGRNAGKWTNIPVPSNWELQGFGKYNYGFAKDSSRGKEKGLYKYRFQAPKSWQDKALNLVFEGVMTDAEVKINGKSAGEIHQGAYYAFKYPIAQLLNYGAENLLEVTVSKHSANQSVNEAERKGDFWIFGGIFRPVYIEVLPVQHITRVSIDAKANGNLKAVIRTTSNNTSLTLSAQLHTLNGQKVGTPIQATLKAGQSELTLEKLYQNVQLWTSETPNRYKLTISLLQNGKAVHVVEKKIGFRTVEVKLRDGVYVNGTKVKFKGVNRHSFWPTSGRTTSKAVSLLDVQLMKDMNMNAVRMSHYPPDDHFLDTCDSLGLFVMDELAGWHGNYDTPTGTKRLEELMEHDENHPSVIFWINGNEGGHNYELDPIFPQKDLQKRPVIHAWEDFAGFDTQHYRDYNYGICNYDHGHSIVMPTEFLHGMYDGGHGAGLEDYWEHMWATPLCAGGFLWDFVDQGIVRTDKNGVLDTDGNRAADGIVGPYREKEGSYFTIKEVWSPIKFEAKEITSDFDGKFTIENRYHFTNTSQCRFTWKLKSLGLYQLPELSGKVLSPNLKPLEKGTVACQQLPRNWQQYDVLYVSAFDAYGKEIFTWSFKITLPKTMAQAIVQTSGSSKPTLQEQDSLFVVKANGLTISFSKKSGLLKSVQTEKGAIPFNNGPIVQEGSTNFKNITTRFEGENLIIESTYDKKEAFNTLQWTIYPSGWVKLKVKYFPAAYLTNYFGLNFSFPESEIKGVEYLGNGPYRVWKNRLKGNQFGIWKKDYNTTETGEIPFVYPEFKGYHSNMYWCKFITKGQPFTVVTETEDVFFRLFSPAFKTDSYQNYVINFPTGDISFMQGISAIGSKTNRADNTGPMSMKHVFYDYEKEPKRAVEIVLYFDFLK
ncbi:glycoside hydrolase family 2 TIM barrel-domain containing protein [Flectobacillus sp. BAB-3569]|uniref:glycoside hydrolase family 2 TIM barrel-domain containing protein n=1 Tax=Flectobacillus sp. BAB-3569 TaxID=1509483 RepID=UPI000BA49049|nr:glycoside hydrolase family 2 TIM barrel-domain containing protein [Flectobacillus sp. BAB-3569]PAC28852.1 glycoside hydrolase family 2 [Flectobacillus sp. BAB-3569]